MMHPDSGTEVRPLREQDVAALVDAYHWLFAPPASVPTAWNPLVASERLRRLIADERSTAFIAVLASEIIGFCTVYLDLESVRFGQRAWLNDLAVDPRQRSRGVGHQLLDTARKWARRKGATVLQLDSSLARVDAHRFYRREQPTFEALCFGWQL